MTYYTERGDRETLISDVEDLAAAAPISAEKHSRGSFTTVSLYQIFLNFSSERSEIFGKEIQKTFPGNYRFFEKV